MLKYFIKYHNTKIARYYNENKLARILVSLAILIIMTLIAWAIFQATSYGLKFTQIENDDFLNKIGSLYIYEIFLLLTGFFVFVSSIIFSLVNFFKTNSDSWIMSSPGYKDILALNSFKAVYSSSWAIIIISIPLLIAVCQVFSLSFFSVAIAFLAVSFFIIICSLLAILTMFFFSILIKILKLKNLKILFFLMGTLVLSIAVFIWQRIVNMDLEKVFQIENITNSSLSFFMQQFSVFPSHFPALTIFYLQENNINLALQNLLIITVVLIIICLVIKLLKNKYLYIWQTFQEGSFEARSNGKKTKKPLIIKGFPKTAEGVIFKKELLTGLRVSKNILWFSFLALILFAQVGVISLLEKYSNIGDGLILGDNLMAIQMAIVLFFITAFILRFVFPSFSQESGTSWLIGSSPIKMSKIFISKYKFFSLILSLLAVFSLFLYIIPLAINLNMAIFLILISILATITLTMLGLSLGTIYINFESDDPGDLSTTGPGIMFMIFALAYTFLSSYLFYLSISNFSYLPIILFLTLSFIIIFVAKKLAIKKLDNMEFY